MGTVLEMGAFRRRRAGPHGPWDDYAFFHNIEGPCLGCGARRAFLVAFHDTGTDAVGTLVFSRTLPHFACDGKQVTEQEDPRLDESTRRPYN